MKTKIALASILAIMLGAAWFVWRGILDDDAGLRSTEVPAEVDVFTTKPPKGPSPPSIVTQPYRDPSPSPDAPPVTPGTGWLLSGVLVGTDDQPPVSAAVQARPIAKDWRDDAPGGSAAGNTDTDARFEIDVTDLVTSAVGEFEVGADHPDYLPASTKIHVNQAIAGGGSYRLTVRLELKGARQFTGRVVDASGEPVAGAQVAALLDAKDSEWRREVDLATTDDDGGYRVRTGLDGAWRITAVAPGLVPASHRVDAATTGTELPELVLANGVAISGTVAIAGEPVPHAVVEGRRLAGGDVTIGGRKFEFQEGRFCRGSARATCDDRGRFQIDGLLPGAFDLALMRIPGCALHQSIGANAPTRVSAPASGVAFDLESARIDVLVRHEGSPVAGLGLMMSGDGAVGTRTDSEGKAGVLVKPDETYQIMISEKAYELVEKEVIAPAAGETHTETVVLVPRRERPSLLVTFRTEAGTPLTGAGFGFYEQGAPRSPRFWRDVVAKDGRFLVGDLRPGRWRIVCRPGVWAGSHEYLLDTETTVEVPEHGAVSIAVATRPGGRLRIAARNPEGQPVQARCRLMQGSAVLPATFRTQYGSGYSMGAHGVGAGVSDVLRALPAGVYRVSFTEEGYREHLADVIITAGETTELDVTLIPTDR